MDFNAFSKNLPCEIVKYELYDGNINNILLYQEQYNSINKTKTLIDGIHNWDKIKKFSNKYELIHISQSNKRYRSISSYIPISRSFFKLWQILHDNALLLDKNGITTLSLAEGPGGFMEALSFYRKNKSDKYYGVTLDGHGSKVPNWKMLLNKASKSDIFNNMNTIYGDLYNIMTIHRINGIVKNKVDLITADGGFDFSIDFCNQEKSSHKIVFAEIIYGLIFLKINGTFICKIFDVFTTLTCKMIYILSCLYKNIKIVKPDMSRPCNSEKYIIAEGYNGIDSKLLDSLIKMLNIWDTNNYSIVDFPEIILPDEFIHMFAKYNNIYCDTQNNSISNTISKFNGNRRSINYSEIYKEQYNVGIEWCKKYKLNINTSCTNLIHLSNNVELNNANCNKVSKVSKVF
jgi:23S rRNA U2552 (ribose-2'-O)-methylase RlmE/FtsJ